MAIRLQYTSSGYTSSRSSSSWLCEAAAQAGGPPRAAGVSSAQSAFQGRQLLGEVDGQRKEPVGQLAFGHPHLETLVGKPACVEADAGGEARAPEKLVQGLERPGRRRLDL